MYLVCRRCLRVRICVVAVYAITYCLVASFVDCEKGIGIGFDILEYWNRRSVACHILETKLLLIYTVENWENLCCFTLSFL